MKYLLWPFLRVTALVLLVLVTVFGFLRAVLRALTGANQIPPPTSGRLLQFLALPVFMPIVFIYFASARLYLETMVLDVKLGFAKPEEALRVVAQTFPEKYGYWYMRFFRGEAEEEPSAGQAEEPVPVGKTELERARDKRRVLSETLITEVDPSSLIPETMKVSHDCKRVTYVIAVGEKFSVVVDGVEGKPYDGILEGTTIFAPNSQKLGYMAGVGNKRFLVLDGVEGKRYDDVNRFVFSPDSHHVAYGAKAGGKWLVVVDGNEGKKYDGIGDPTFSPDSQKLVYVAGAGNKMFLVENGTEGRQYDCIMEGNPVFSPDSKRMAYGVKAGSKWLVIVDGIEGKQYDGIGGDPTFSPDSQKLVYALTVVSPSHGAC